MGKLNIPTSKKFKGLFVFCNECKMNSKTKLKPSDKCTHPEDKIVFRAIITIPGTKSIRSRLLKTRDVDEAIKQTIDFKKEQLANDYKPVVKKESDNNPVDLVSCIVMYLDYLENKNVYSHQVNPRSKAHIKQVTSHLKKFVNVLSSEIRNIRGLLVRHINDEHAGMWYKYILEKHPEYSNRTINRYMDSISEFFDYLIKKKHYTLTNYFSAENITRKRVHSHIETISMAEFKEFLNIITKDNGIEVLLTGERKNHYHDWLKDAFEFALYSGRRRDEIMNVKFSDIRESDGKPIYIITEDYKYNRKNNLTKKEEKKYNYSPVILDMHLFLQKIGYKEYKGTDRFLIAPNSTRTRDTLKDDMSKGFTHYYKQLNIDKHLEFKHLRKTYITLLNNFTNGHAEVITGQIGQELILNNYQDRKIFDDVILNFKMIS